MNWKQLSIGTILLIVAVSGAFAQCSVLLLDGDHLRHVEQYKEIKVKMVAYTNCSDAAYEITTYSDIPIRIDQDLFVLGTGSKAVMVTIAPGAAEPGLYTAHFLMKSDQDIAREEFVVKVAKTNKPLLIASAPAVMSIHENEEFDIAIAITNKDEVVLNNVMVFIDEEGVERVYADELESLQTSETKYVNFHYGPRPRGEYTLNYTVVAGEFKFRGQTLIGSSSKNYPFSTMLTIYPHDGGYLTNYLVKNIGSTKLNDLFLTVEDAPSDWSIISPSKFSLNPGETKEVELVALYGETRDVTLTLALYEGHVLRAEDTLFLSQSRLRGTGLISFAESFELGSVVLLFAALLFLGYRLRKNSKEKNIDLRSMLPDWIDSIWPF